MPTGVHSAGPARTGGGRRRRLGALLTAIASIVAAGALGTATAPEAQAQTGSCPPILVLGSRGSGESFGLGPTVRPAAKTIEDGLGERVFIEANPYPAVGLTSSAGQFVNALGAGLRIARVGAYHDSVVDGKDWLRGRIKRAVDRCGDRTWIVLIGYSQGAQVSADIYQTLPVAHRKRVAGMILFGDPYFNGKSAGGRGDYSSRHDGALGTRPAYSAVDGRDSVRSYCHKRDPVCQGDDAPSALRRYGTSLRFSAHKNYDELGEPEDAGRWMSTRLRTLPFASAPNTPPPAPTAPTPQPVPQPAPASEPAPAPAPDASPRPYAGNLIAVNHGGGRVGVAFDVGWQEGRDPVTCHVFRNDVEVFSAQCGTRSSKQFTDVPPGTHTFHAVVRDRFGVESDPTNRVTIAVSAPAPAPDPAPAPAPAGDTLLPDQRLTAASGDSIRSSDGRYRFVLQGDGNLVLYGPSGGAIWTTSTVGRGDHLRMQGDGNLVLYTAGNVPIWSSRTPGNPGARLVIQSDGNVVLYNGSRPIWATGTAGRT